MRFSSAPLEWHDQCDKIYRDNLITLIKDHPGKIVFIDGRKIINIVEDSLVRDIMQEYRQQGRQVSFYGIPRKQ